MLTLSFVCALFVALPALAEPRTGDIISFGSFEQDNDKKNGKEPIEWIVLDVTNGKAFLVSRYVLTAREFHTSNSVEWHKSAIRKWLNDTFLNNFSEKEQKAIVQTTVDNSASQSDGGKVSGGKDTKDKIFLLSYAEVAQYFPEKKDRRAVYSDAAIKASLDGSTSFKERKSFLQEYYDGCYVWYLRSFKSNMLASSACPDTIDSDGETGMIGCTPTLIQGIRPALVLNLKTANGLYQVVQSSGASADRAASSAVTMAEPEELCGIYYLKKIKSSVTAEKMVTNDGQEAVMAALIYMEVDRYYTEKIKTNPVAVFGKPILDYLSDDLRPVYAGLDKNKNGLAAFPVMGDMYQIYSWNKKKNILPGHV
ncbi:MAG: hypothetical protein IJ181_08850 [Acidaminococcaceae bacterium]|nr:hypothetical protein [Acidaminococcaceae bacterium]